MSCAYWNSPLGTFCGDVWAARYLWNVPVRRAGPPPTMRRRLLTAKRAHPSDAPLPQSTSPAKPPLLTRPAPMPEASQQVAGGRAQRHHRIPVPRRPAPRQGCQRRNPKGPTLKEKPLSAITQSAQPENHFPAKTRRGADGVGASLVGAARSLVASPIARSFPQPQPQSNAAIPRPPSRSPRFPRQKPLGRPY